MDLTVVGMMSGTSYDAVDTAIADMALDGDTVVLRPRGTLSAPVPEEMRARIAGCLPPRATTLAEICRLDTDLGQLFGQVAADAVRSITDDGADLVVSHGQTMYHWVEDSRALGTLQLGAPAWIASATGLPVVSDLRSRDLTRGGQGAPLASTLDSMLLMGDDARRGALNLGGIANITVRDGDGSVRAYDIGPASALMDAAVADATGGRERMDLDGRRAKRGTVQQALLDRLFGEPYYEMSPPKSTGKELFNVEYLRAMVGNDPVSTDDVLATLTELTAQLVAGACRRHDIRELVISGGGLRNPALMERIRDLCRPAAVVPIDNWGIPSQAKEAYLCALLGYLSVHGLPGSIASATGAAAGSVLGSFTPGEKAFRLPEPANVMPGRLHVVGA